MEMNRALHIPRLVIGGLRGGSGKTIITIGILSFFRCMGLKVQGFKKGPDFIDPGWLSLAAKQPCRNLDAFIMDPKRLCGHFVSSSMGYDVVVIEGNRGIYDGMDVAGSFSTAELSKSLKAPLALVVDVTMSTRTVAALVKGCQVLDPQVPLKAVILNKVANQRQEMLIREAIKTECGIPVAGAIPKQRQNPFPERHMGLLPHREQEKALQAVEWAQGLVERYVDMDMLLSIAKEAEPLEFSTHTTETPKAYEAQRPKIGVMLDRAFWFYYPENLELLRNLGAQITFMDALKDERVPEIHGLYIGGGFPETQAEALANNVAFRRGLRDLVNNGLPVYGECGGLIYLGKGINYRGGHYPMLDIFPVEFAFQDSPAGHGYTEFEVVLPNPYYALHKVVRAHEFHYSLPNPFEGSKLDFAFKVIRGNGFFQKTDGLVKGPVLGTYMHVHALGESSWAQGLLYLASLYAQKAHLGEKKFIDKSGTLV
jgi:cobyrinic acid a,c-diamide synthase